MKEKLVVANNIVEWSSNHSSILRTIIDAMPTGIQILRASRDDRGRIIDFMYVMVNRIARDYTGDLEGVSFLTAYPGSVESFERLCEVTHSGNSIESMHPYKLGNAEHWFNVTYTKFDDGVLLSHEDITAMRQLEEETRHNQQFITHIADSTPDIIYVADVDAHRLVYLNERVKDSTGYTAAEILAKGWAIFPETLHPDDYAPRMRVIDEMLTSDDNETREIEVKVRVKDGSYRWFRLRERIFKRKPDGTASAIIGVGTDIHSTKEMALLAREKEKQWQSLVDHMPDPIARFDKKLRFIFANKAFLTAMGITEQELYGKDNLEIGMPPDVAVPWMVLLRKVFITGKPDQLSAFYPVGGNRLFFTTKVIPEFDESGRVSGVLAIGQDRTIERQAEDLFNTKNELLQSLINAPGLGFSIFKAIRNKQNEIVDFEFVMLSKKGEELTGRNDLVGKRLFEEFPSTKSSLPRFKKVVETGESDVHTLAVSDGMVDGWFLTFSARLGDGLIKIWEDVTEKKQGEEKVEEYARFIEAITRATPDLIHVFNMEKKEVAYSNRSIFLSELGYPREVAETMNFSSIESLIHPDDWQKAIDHWTKMATAVDDDILEMEFRMKAYEGDWKWFCCRSKVFKRDERGKVIQYLCLHQNITKHKEAADMVQKSQMHFRSLVDHTPDAISRWDRNLKLVFCNNAFLKKTGKTAASVLGKNHTDMGFAPDVAGPWMEKLVEVFETGKEVRHYYPEMSPLGVRHSYAAIVPEFDQQNKLQFVLAIDRDITRVVKSAEKIHELDDTLVARNHELAFLNSELNTFTSIAVNNYKDTLRNLYTSLEYVASHDARHLTDPGKANIRRAQSAIQKLQLLTDDVITYGRIHEHETIPISVQLDAILEKAIHDLDAKIKECKAHITVAPLPVVKGFSSLLTLLFRHLLDNAIKFRNTASAPVIEITSDRADEIGDGLMAFKNTPYHVISIHDNGIGFDEMYAEKIFELFFRLHEKNYYKGSGVGLGICKKIMTMHEGYITASSKPGEGSVFRCYFPERA